MNGDVEERLFGRHSSTVLREQVRETVAKSHGRTIRFDVFNNRERGVVEDELKRIGFSGPHFFSAVAGGDGWNGKEYSRLSNPQDKPPA